MLKDWNKNQISGNLAGVPYFPVILLKIFFTSDTKCWWGYGTLGTFFADGNVYWCNHFEKILLVSIMYTPMMLQFCTWIYPTDMKVYLHQDMYKNIHISFIHSSPKLETIKAFLSTVEWISTLFHIDSTECYTAMRRSTLLAYEQHRGILQTECWGKEARYKSIHVIFFHLYVAQKQANLLYG